MALVGVPSVVVPDLWPNIEPHIRACLDVFAEHRWEPEDIYNALLSTDMQLWIIVDPDFHAAIVTEITRYPRATELNIFLVHGDIPGGWEAPLKQMEEWAVSQGCTHVSTTGRRGVAKKFEALGYDVRQTYVVKTLSKEADA